jgi:hypothetical protein
MRGTYEHKDRTVFMDGPDKPGHDVEGFAHDHPSDSSVSGVQRRRRRSVRVSGVSPS